MESYNFQVWVSCIQQLRVAANSKLVVLFSFDNFQRQAIHPKYQGNSVQQTFNADGSISSVRVDDGRSCTVDVPGGQRGAAGSYSGLIYQPPKNFDVWLVDEATGRQLVVGSATIPFPAASVGGQQPEMAHSLFDNQGHVVGTAMLSSKWSKMSLPSSGSSQSVTTSATHLPPQQLNLNTTPAAAAGGGAGAGGTTTTGQPKTYVLKVNMDSRSTRRHEEEAHAKKRTNVARKKTLLHLLQYDVAYQLKSASNHLVVTLEREHTKLNEVSAPTTQQPLSRLSINVNHIIRLLNIAVQVCEDLIGERTGGMGESNPINKLPQSKPGSVAHFLQYDVLYQVQCLATHLSYVIQHHRARLEVSLSSLHRQHSKFMQLLAKEVASLTRSVNVVVQSTLDGNLGSKEALIAAANENYSDDSSSDSGSSSDDSVASMAEEVASDNVPKPRPATVGERAAQQLARQPSTVISQPPAQQQPQPQPVPVQQPFSVAPPAPQAPFSAPAVAPVAPVAAVQPVQVQVAAPVVQQQ